jgi:hypothetical protein
MNREEGYALKKGAMVRIISLTDVDTKLPESWHDFPELIGQVATIVDPAINDYYDCIIQLTEPVGELGSPYGHPPRLAFLYCDLELITRYCSKCAGDDRFTHDIDEHSEDWANLADARQSGEVIFMSPMLIHYALESLQIPITHNERAKTHVDRRIIQAIVDALKEQDPYGDESVGIWTNYDQASLLEALEQELHKNPIQELEY